MSSIHGISHWLWRSKLLLSLLILFSAGIALSPQDNEGANIFLASGNLLNILRQVSITGILAVGMTLVILTGGIDLAVGSLMAFGATLCAMILTLDESHHGLWVGGMSFGLCAGLLVLSVIAWVFSRRNGSPLSGSQLELGRQPSATKAVIIFCLKTLVLAACIYAGLQIFKQWQNQSPLLMVIMACICACAVLGAVSGTLVARGGLQAFIATLAMMVASLGLARLMAGQDRSVFPIYSGINVSENFDYLRESVFGIPVPGLVFLAVVLLFSVLLGHFRFGRYIYAIGGNERAAFLSGIPVRKIKVWVYTLSGALAGLAGVLYCAQYQQGKPDAGTGLELDAIAAVVIGGANLMGGRGSVWGTLVGVFIFGVLSNILQLNNVDSNSQLVLKGLIIIVAVLIQQAQWDRYLAFFTKAR